jgi:hypothetical protein
MIEAGNLLMMPGRQAPLPARSRKRQAWMLEPPEITALMNKDRKSFDGFAAALQGLAVEALGPSRRKTARRWAKSAAAWRTCARAATRPFGTLRPRHPKPLDARVILG